MRVFSMKTCRRTSLSVYWKIIMSVGTGLLCRYIPASNTFFGTSSSAHLLPRVAFPSTFSSGSTTLRLRFRKLKREMSSSPFRRSAFTMMPEGPEVRTLVDQLQPAVGQRLVNLQFLSGRYTRHGYPRGFEEFRRTMTNYFSKEGTQVQEGGEGTGFENMASSNQVDIIKEWNAKGKFIYVVLDDGKRPKDKGYLATDIAREGMKEINYNNDGGAGNNDDYQRSIWITLGMSGRFVNDAGGPTDNTEEEETSRKNINTQARWFMEFVALRNASDTNATTSTKTRKIYFYDQRNFGTLRFSLSKKELLSKLSSLGPDILDDCTQELFLDIAMKQNPQLNICKFLMNQSKISGVGNYILAEGLYRSKLDPFASIEEISLEQRKVLFQELRSVASNSYAAQGVTRANGGTYRDVDGNKGRFELECYGRDFCLREGEPVIRETNGPHGRTIWYVDSQLFVPLSKRFSQSWNDSDTSDLENSDCRGEMIDSIEGGSRNVDVPVLATPNTDVDLSSTLIEDSWKTILGPFLASEKFERLSRFVESERKNEAVYPPPNDVFSAFNSCPFDKVKVVIVGQDPYHGPGQGHGLAFSVQKNMKVPPSLQNIFKEAMSDEGIDQPKHGNLEKWSEQGVLLLNTVLTVRRGEANSHSKMGWEDFTDEVIQVLNDGKEGLVFLLWGGPAAKKARGVNRDKHVIIASSHPSPLGATKTKSPFLGSRCFSRCNSELTKRGKDPIDWNVL